MHSIEGNKEEVEIEIDRRKLNKRERNKERDEIDKRNIEKDRDTER